MRLIDGDRLIEWLEDNEQRGRVLNLPDIRFIVAELAKQYAIEDAGREPSPRWISTGDRLPDESVEYLVYVTSNNGEKYVTTDHWLKTPRLRWYLFDDAEAVVTHWMPMPEPPKENNA